MQATEPARFATLPTTQMRTTPPPQPPTDFTSDDRFGRMLRQLAVVVGTIAVFATVVIVVVGGVYALVENNYTVADYLEDLKALVLALAALLIAMELPAAIHRRINRNGGN